MRSRDRRLRAALRRFGRRVDPLVPADVEWIVAAIESGSLSIPLPAFTAVPVTFWLIAVDTDVAKAEAVRDRQLFSAFSILEEMGTGLTLDTISITQPVTAMPDPDCAKAGDIAVDATIYAPDRINVYYVAYYRNQVGASYAIDCWLKDHPEIVFVSWKNPNTPDVALAHEMGHAMGLVHPKLAPAWPQIGGGHTNNAPGFGSFNLMESGAASVTNISVGQLYAMNFGLSSWLNRSGSTMTRPVVHDCQDAWGIGDCPKLTLFEAGWPVPP